MNIINENVRVPWKCELGLVGIEAEWSYVSSDMWMDPFDTEMYHMSLT